MEALGEMLPGHLISLRGDTGWPENSPDLPNPCDYFLWGCLKVEGYRHRPATVEELTLFVKKVAEILPEIILRVMENFRNCLQQ